MSEKKPDPREDGVTHINIWTKGKTRLGRLLTHLSEIPVDHPTYGRFRCAEGLWYYLTTGKSDETLRSMHGFEAKAHGRTLEKVWNADFHEEFKAGLRARVEGHSELKMLLIESTLPLVHYYVYEKPGKLPAVIIPKNQEWILEFNEVLRAELRKPYLDPAIE